MIFDQISLLELVILDQQVYGRCSFYVLGFVSIGYCIDFSLHTFRITIVVI